MGVAPSELGVSSIIDYSGRVKPSPVEVTSTVLIDLCIFNRVSCPQRAVATHGFMVT